MSARLSVIIPARNERWLSKTIEDALAHSSDATEIIAILDGAWPDPPVQDHPRVHLVHHSVSVGQRAATNEGARLSTAEYIMKADAHVSFDQDFDTKLMAPYESGELTRDTTTIPRMFALHVYDEVCVGCAKRYYQADPVPVCECGSTEFRIEEVWTPRLFRMTDFARFDHTMHFQYFKKYARRPEAQGDICDVMSSVGACFFMRRDRFFELGGMDEGHGSWGQFGTEISCKSWLSGGRQVVNKRTWFAHMFRVGKLKFPYPLSGEAQERARVYSRDLWLNDKWPKATRSLSWLIEKFAPVRGWHDPEGAETLALVMAEGAKFMRRQQGRAA